MKTAQLLPSVIVAIIGFAAGAFLSSEARREPITITRQSTSVPPPQSTADPIARAMAIFTRGDGSLREMAEISEVFSSLDRMQLTELANRIERLPYSTMADSMTNFLAAWTRRDPYAATEWIRPRLDDYARFRRLISEITLTTYPCSVWAENAPGKTLEKALEYVQSNPDFTAATGMLTFAINQLKEWPHSERFKLLRGIPAGQARRYAMIDVFASWASSDFDEALTAAQSLSPGKERDRMVGEVIASLAEKDPDGAFRQLAKSGLRDPMTTSVVVAQGAQRNPEATAQWLDEQPDLPDFKRCRSLLVNAWAKTDPSAAFEWARTHDVSITKELLLDRKFYGEWSQHAEALFMRRPIDNPGEKTKTAEWIKQLPAGAERTRLIEQTAMSYIWSRDEIRDLAAELPAESQARIAARRVSAMGYDNEVKIEFAESFPTGLVRDAVWRAIGQDCDSADSIPLPPGRDRDAILVEIARSNKCTGIESRWSLIQEVSDPERRRAAFDDLALALDTKGPICADDETLINLLNHPGIPEEWKAAWR